MGLFNGAVYVDLSCFHEFDLDGRWKRGREKVMLCGLLDIRGFEVSCGVS